MFFNIFAMNLNARLKIYECRDIINPTRELLDETPDLRGQGVDNHDRHKGVPQMYGRRILNG